MQQIEFKEEKQLNLLTMQHDQGIAQAAYMADGPRKNCHAGFRRRHIGAQTGMAAPGRCGKS